LTERIVLTKTHQTHVCMVLTESYVHIS